MTELKLQLIHLNMTSQDTAIVSKVKELESRLGIMERSNQVNRISSGGINVIDSTGLVSTSNFTFGQSFNGSAGLSTSSTTMIDVSGSSLSAFTTTRTQNILFWLMGYGYNSDNINSNGSNTMEVSLYDNIYGGSVANVLVPGSCTTKVEIVGITTNYTMSTSDLMISRTALVTLGAGTHNLKLQYKALNGGTAYLNSWLIGYLLLGK